MMRGLRDVTVVRKQSGKVVLPATVINGSTAKAQLKWSDTEYYQVAAHGDYVQGQ